jgi:hypothetical protein
MTMTTSDMIQFGALLLTVLSLLIQQAALLGEVRRKELRISTKLQIFYFCQSEGRTEREIENQFSQAQPTNPRVNLVELRKAIYEMLAEETLRYRTNNTYLARRNKAIEGENA